jgi:hypothetical protein
MIVVDFVLPRRRGLGGSSDHPAGEGHDHVWPDQSHAEPDERQPDTIARDTHSMLPRANDTAESPITATPHPMTAIALSMSRWVISAAFNRSPLPGRHGRHPIQHVPGSRAMGTSGQHTETPAPAAPRPTWHIWLTGRNRGMGKRQASEETQEGRAKTYARHETGKRSKFVRSR